MTFRQKQNMRKMRLSGDYTWQEIATKYNVSWQRVQQIVGIIGIKKGKKKACIICGNIFINRLTRDRNKCAFYHKIELALQKCFDCSKSFMPLSVNNILRCQPCYKEYRKNQINEANKKSYKKRRLLTKPK